MFQHLTLNPFGIQKLHILRIRDRVFCYVKIFGQGNLMLGFISTTIRLGRSRIEAGIICIVRIATVG